MPEDYVRTRIVRVSAELFLQLMVANNRIDAVCIEGLPQDARMTGWHHYGNHEIHLMFTSESWDRGPIIQADMPEVIVKMRSLYSDDLLDQAFDIIAASQDKDALDWIAAYLRHKEARNA
jgi:hypothetical protein